MNDSLFAVRFQDDQAHHETRRKYLKAHLEWLDQNSEHVLIAGSLRNEPDEVPIGGLWIVKASSKEAVESLIKTDPFWRHNLRRGVEILYWSKAFSDRQVAI